MSPEQLVAAVGSPEPRNSWRARDYSRLQWTNGIVALVSDASDGVFSVTTQESRFATPRGVRVGMSEIEARALLGSPARKSRTTQPTIDYYCYPGLQLMIMDGEIKAITVAWRHTECP